MPYNFVADSFHTKKLCSRLSSREVRFQRENGRFAFLSPLWGLGSTYDNHLRLIGKRVVDFLLIELFSLGVTAEALLARFKISHFAPLGVG